MTARAQGSEIHQASPSGVAAPAPLVWSDWRRAVMPQERLFRTCLRAGGGASRATSANPLSEWQVSACPRESPQDRNGPQRVAAASQDFHGVGSAFECYSSLDVAALGCKDCNGAQ